jgi:SAM-dependent methyltransferase
VRSDPVLDAASLVQLYQASTFDYGSELDGLRRTYGRALDELARVAERPGRLLDIGAGNGFVLEVAEDHGWREAWGIEPSEHARRHARPHLRERIKADVIRPGLFAPASFHGISLFQVLDHLSDPASVLEECRELLVPGGAILAFNHNVSSWSARLLGERSPIIDVEHTYLYSPKTMRALFERAGFSVVAVRPVRNTYSLRYLVQLLPLPRALKTAALAALGGSKLGTLPLTVPLGNLCLIARRTA